MTKSTPSQPLFGMRRERTAITMSDGVRLAATLYLPDGAPEGERFPALLEFLPYRKDDGTINRDVPRYEYFTRRGYAGARVDVRGTGASEGVDEDEYSEQEGRDALEVIAWLAAQPWCNGNVGMWGISYGGFNAIQIAMLKPPALKAIIPVDATDDVYTDDIVYWNGALQFESLGRWPFSMIAPNGTPGYPDYDVHSEAARQRFEDEPWIFEWLRQQRDGSYWRRMSLRPRYEAIEIPTMMIGGWLDGYTDSIPRMLAEMKAPVRAIVGPWPHAWPETAKPGPNIDSRRDILRFWDHWLKDNDTGLMDEPALAVYVQRWYPPKVGVESIPGEWRYEDGWPVKRLREQAWYPRADGSLSKGRSPRAGFERSLEYKATVGTSNRYRVPHNPAELFSDQRADDAYSLSFTSPPLDADLEILGFPRAVLYVSATASVANWIVRLSDVAPDGASMLVAKGILPGTHREGHTDPKSLTPGEVYELEIDLKFNSWVFERGHRVRLSVANADFPNIWPSPYSMTTTLYVGADRPSRVILPVCPLADRPRPDYVEPEPVGATQGGPVNQWQNIRDEMTQTATVFRETLVADYPVPSEGEPINMSHFERRWCTASDADPARAILRAEGQRKVRRGDDDVTVNSRMSVESNESAFRLKVRSELLMNGRMVRQKEWEERIPRDGI